MARQNHGRRPGATTSNQPSEEDRRSAAVLSAAQVMFEHGEQTSQVVAITERLAQSLGVRASLRASWGHLDLFSPENGLRSVAALPEVVNLRQVQQGRQAAYLAEGGDPGLAALQDRLSRARAAPPARLWLFAAAAAAAAGALVVLWGLSAPLAVLTVAAAAAVGALLRRGMARLGFGPVAQIFVAALLGGIVGTVAGAAGLPDPGLIAIGPALVLVPGPQLLNGGLDISGGRLSLGLCRLLYAFVTLFAISAGILLGLAIGGNTLAVYSSAPALPLPIDAICGAIAAGGYAVFFAMPLKYLPIPVLVGAAAHVLHSALIAAFSLNAAVASGIGALLAGAILIPVAQRLRIPFAGIGFASVVAMVPSVYIHRAVSALLQMEQAQGRAPFQMLDQAAFDAITAVLVLLALVLGLVLPFHAYRAAGIWNVGGTP